MNDDIKIRAEYVFVNPPIVNEIIANETIAKDIVGRDDFAPTDGAWLKRLADDLCRDANDANAAAPRKTANGSPLDRMERDYGYGMTIDEPDCKQWISRDVTTDDKGLNVRNQRVLTIRRDANNGECWIAKFSHDRETKFVVMVYGGLSRARALAFDALLAWHRKAKTAKVAPRETPSVR